MTPKQAAFAREFVIDCNAAAAARRAGYAAATANREGSRLLSNVDVQEAIAAAQAERARRVEANADDVLRELMTLAYSDLRGVFVDVPGGGLRVKPVRAWPADLGRALASVKVRQSMEKRADGSFEPMEVLEFRLHPKPEALKALAQHLGLLKTRVEMTGKDGEALKMVVVEELVDADLSPGDKGSEATVTVVEELLVEE